ncbi:uncharacterized protein jcada isoform X2 [Thalassophryne amazonica]|uniref:uncharacterized protein jcada isoform X2 n=1 Tax=Thalassophryne amazonica TaxID=390379 RepID=UPI001470D609|nr:uncharacterized protein jcada isoform X2 [Thalassophryne amazonica]
MYSVEDLLISHGYKVPKHSASSPSTPVPTSSSQQAPSSLPPSYIKHIEVLENRPGSRSVNGNERGSGFSYGSSSRIAEPQAYSGSSPNNNSECRDRSQSSRESEGRIQTDTHSLGESLTSDSGYRGDMYQQIQMAPDGSHWVIRHPTSFWPDMQRERSTSSQKHLYPVYTKNHPGGGIQYIPFGDPSIRHISSSLSGNSLTDADKIRHIRNELPSVTVSEPASVDSAFLPPPLGTFISAKMTGDINQTSSNDFDNASSRWHGDLHKQTVDNFPAIDQNCNNTYSKNHHFFPSNSSAFQAPTRKSSSHQGSSSEQVFTETITHVKKIDPDLGPENNRSTKRKVSETIFCLVSVPVHTPINVIKDSSADQNNNETISSLTVTKMEKFAVGLKEGQNLRSKSVTEMPIRSHYSHFHTSSSPSVRNYKRAPLRKEIIDAWALQAREDKELCYAGSLPGNQYRNQETQTGSPLTVAASPVTTFGEQTVVQSALHTTRDTAVGTDSTSSYDYTMAGQNNLHPSSNSAFSRLSLSPLQLPSVQVVQPEMSSPIKVKNQGDPQPLSPKKSTSSPPENAEQVAFGQFLLKPMNRRPCDAIGELECINKELQHRIGKRSNLARCTKDLDEMYKKLDWYQFRVPSHNTAHFTAGPEPGRKAVSLLHINKPKIMKVRSESLVFSTDFDCLGLKSAMPGPQANITSSKNEVSPLHNPDSYLLSSPPSHKSHKLYKPDIPVPQESLLRNVGLTVYTETPGHPGEPMQRSLSLPSPLDMQAVQQSCKKRRPLVKNRSNPEHSSHEGFQLEKEIGKQVNIDSIPQFRGELNFNVCGTLSENGSFNSAGSPHTNRLTVETAEDNDGGEESSNISEPRTYSNESTVADKHLENLLIQEKVSVSHAEDLSNLFEVKSAEGIPENESVEQRAARILGIAIPVEALCVTDKHTEHTQTDTDTTAAKMHSASKETQQLIRLDEQVLKDTLIVQGAEIDEVKESELGIDYEDQRRKHSNTPCNNVEITHHIQETQSTVALDLPEFPPTSLPLSLPVIPNGKRGLSMCSEENWGQSVASKLTESLPEKPSFSSVTPLSRSTPDSIITLKVVESVPSIRHLSHKSSDSEEEADPKERDTEECRRQEQTLQDILKKKKDEDRKLLKETKAESNCKCKEENNVEICKNQQREEETIANANVGIALNAQSEKSNKEELDVKVKLKIAEDDTKKTVETVRDGQKTEQVYRVEATQDTEGKELPKPKQRTRLRKPPLLPKPRTVSKAEVPVALIFSTGSCGHVEDEEVLSVSDSYDPSRVERV